jgi:predicted lipoprotein with Yx(FWY)xxD motif
MGLRPPARRRTAVVVATAAMAAGLLIGLGGMATASAAGAASMQPAVVGGPAANIPSNRAVVSMLTTPAYGSVLVVGGSGPLAGAPLYAISSDAYGRFGCTTVLTNTFQGPITCTGPESDIANNVQTDEWPAFTTTGDPVAGPGVNDDLLGSVVRPGVGRQVTYAGHPLYLFDPPSNPFTPFGEGFFETVAPSPPWHGLWTLVASRSGLPAPGVASIGSETLPDGKAALAAEEYPNTGPGGSAITVYALSRDGHGEGGWDSRDWDGGGNGDGGSCTGMCTVTWIPVLTTGKPVFTGVLDADDLGVIRLPDGADQVTYHGKPLYLYSGEQAIFPVAGGPPETTGTVGNGNGLHGPDGGTFSIIDPD